MSSNASNVLTALAVGGVLALATGCDPQPEGPPPADRPGEPVPPTDGAAPGEGTGAREPMQPGYGTDARTGDPNTRPEDGGTDIPALPSPTGGESGDDGTVATDPLAPAESETESETESEPAEDADPFPQPNPE